MEENIQELKVRKGLQKNIKTGNAMLNIECKNSETKNYSLRLEVKHSHPYESSF